MKKVIEKIKNKVDKLKDGFNLNAFMVSLGFVVLLMIIFKILKLI